MHDNEKKYAPVKRFVFPAGDCGGEIRVNIPVTASKDDVIRMAKMLMVAAEDWQNYEDDEDFLN